MTSSPGILRRILVALGGSAASLEALSTATSLAARLGAELEGIFVEDVRVLRAAGLPFASQLSLPSGTRRPLDRRSVESELRATAAAARDALAAAAEASGIGWSFRVARGHVSVELLHASTRADLLVVGGSARAARAGAAPAVLIAYDGSAGSNRALALAVQLAPDAASVMLLVTAPTASEAERVARCARVRPGLDALRARWIGGAQWRHLLGALRDLDAPLIVSAESAVIVEGGPRALLEAIASPLLILR